MSSEVGLTDDQLLNMTRRDWFQKVSGQTRYVDDLPELPGTVYGAAVRSPFSHARIVGINSGRALAIPGVLGIIDRDHLDGLDPIVRIGEYAGRTREHGASADQHLLAIDKVRFDGDLVGMIVAETSDIARRAVDAVEVKYEELPAVFSYGDAVAPKAPLVHEDLPSNLACDDWFEWGDVDKGLADAVTVVEASYYTPNAFHHPMEPVGSCVADWGTDEVVLWLPTNKPFNPIGQVVELFGVDRHDVRVRVPEVGGAFGAKQLTPGMMAALALSRRLSRPVRVYATELESFRSTARHACNYRAKAGVDADGRFVALDVELEVDTGAYFTGARLVTRNICISAWGCYRIPSFRVRANTVYTNKVPAASFRATGKTESTFAIESLVDRVAAAAGIDPIQMRLRNALRLGEAVATSWRVRGVEYAADVPAMDTDYAELMRLAMEGIGWRDDTVVNPMPDGRARGRGIALSLRHGAQGGGRTYAMVTLDGKGRAHVSHAAPDLGEGVSNMLQLVAARSLEIHPDQVIVERPETRHGLNFEGTAAQRTTVHMGNAVRGACESLKSEVRVAAAQAWGGKPEEWCVEGGRVTRADESYSLAEVARSQGTAPSFEGDVELKGLGSYSYAPSQEKAFGGLDHWSPGAVAVEVAVDRETGELEVLKMAAAADAGTVIHLPSVIGQLQGGAVMGMGLATTEELIYEDNAMINGDPFQYRLPTIEDVPCEIPVGLIERHDGPGPFGAKGIAQVTSPCITPAINNALLDAVGVQLNQAPVTAERILHATGVLGSE